MIRQPQCPHCPLIIMSNLSERYSTKPFVFIIKHTLNKEIKFKFPHNQITKKNITR